MIIGIHGLIGSGKDLVGKIIQVLTSSNKGIRLEDIEQYLPKMTNTGKGYPYFMKEEVRNMTKWQIKKFATKLREIVSILTGISIEDLEKEEVKEKILPKEWDREIYYDMEGNRIGYICNRTGMFQTKIESLTVRELLQEIGTEAMRNTIHPDIWVNALFSEYKLNTDISFLNEDRVLPNWIITDLRFPNEYERIKKEGGIVVKINRKYRTSQNWSKLFPDTKIVDPDGWDRSNFQYSWHEEQISQEEYMKRLSISTVKYTGKILHLSETMLKGHAFDIVIDNHADIVELAIQVHEKIISQL